ncbi:MAG: radical SAM protein [Promethearchaeota archaeon]
MEENLWNLINGRYPQTHSFISYRKEKEGGFVFNPHLYNEKWINDLYYTIIDLSDGTRTVSNIIDYMSKNFALAESESKNLFYNLLLENQSYFILDLKKNKKNNDQAILNSQFKKNNDFQGDYYSAPISILWDITYRCNMKCSHCLIDEKSGTDEMKLEDIKKILFELKKFHVFIINFSGGEPLVRTDFLDILKATSELNFGIRLSTNGLLITEKLLEKFVDLDVFCIQFSLDGIGDTHDNFRGMKNAYNKTIEAIQLAVEKGFYITISTMITSQTINEIPDIINLAVKMGVSSLKFNTFMPVGRGKKNKDIFVVSKKRLKELALELSKIKKKNERKIDLQIDAVYPWLINSQNIPQNNPNFIEISPKIKCSAAQTNLVISPNGTVYPCPYLSDFPLGNVLNTPINEIWNNNDGILGTFRNQTQSNLKGKCNNCHHVPEKCIGGCRAAAYIETGDLLEEDPFCWK